MNIGNIAKYYLLNFIYIPVSVIYAYSIGEDTNTMMFYVLLALIISLLLYLYDLILTIIGKKIMNNNSVVPFIIPVILIIPFKFVLKSLDFGGKYGVFIIIVGTLLINIFTWSRTRIANEK